MSKRKRALADDRSVDSGKKKAKSAKVRSQSSKGGREAPEKQIEKTAPLKKERKRKNDQTELVPASEHINKATQAENGLVASHGPPGNEPAIQNGDLQPQWMISKLGGGYLAPLEPILTVDEKYDRIDVHLLEDRC